ncbi:MULTISPECIES: hypothetical protein [unclassified Microbacterium]|uniref:hypothetical protein n=1 Tax=unclassified Microbacterium TaxID=2609290 RepID=UPI00109BF335|nr:MULTISPECIES: hypothetical protein [unclassified Microbacterium]
MNEWQFLAAVAVPVFGFLGALGQRERTPGQFRRLREAAAALKDLPPGTEAHAAISELVAAQARSMTAREARTLNVTNLILSMILGGFAAWATYGLSVWCISTWATPWGWVSLTVSIVIGLALMLFVGAAFGTIYNPKSHK